MLNLISLQSAPMPLLRYYGNGEFKMNCELNDNNSTTTYWLFQEPFTSYDLIWWNNGWVIRYQESYLTKKELTFMHKDDIPSFQYSNIGDANKWNHVYLTKEEAIEYFKKYYLKLSGFES